MAYWKINISPQTDTILSKENLTLSEVLDVENVIQDAKNGNKKLLDFLFQPNILEELIDLITKEPNPELPENDKYRHPYIACELLTTDVIVISRPIAENKHLLDKLLSFVDQKPPLNPLLASFFSRTIVSFFTRSVHQDWYMYQYVCLKVLESMKEKESFVKQLVAHIGTSAIMELILKMVKEAETFDMQYSISVWLHSEGLITQLLETLNPKADPICQFNAAQLLCDMGNEFIREVNKPNVIIDILKSTDAVNVLLETILGGEFCETSIVGGISVLLMLLPSMSSLVSVDKMDYKDSDSNPIAGIKCDDELEEEGSVEDQNKEVEGVNGTDAPQPWNQIESLVIRAILPYMKVLHQLLQEPPFKPSFVLTTGHIDPPLGNTRLQITGFIATLIVLNHQDFINELTELSIFKTLLDLFCSYSWNNFYHTQLENCITYALKPVNSRKTEENPLVKHLFVDCEIMQFVLKLWENNSNVESEGGRRQGYMGHLIEIATVINCTLKENSSVEPLLKESFPNVLTDWNQFVEQYLNIINDVQKVCLGGVHPHDAQHEEEVTTSDKKFPDSSFRNTESYFENDTNVDENMNDDGDEVMFEDICAQKGINWISDPYDANDDEDENENEDNDSDDNDEDIEEGTNEENINSEKNVYDNNRETSKEGRRRSSRNADSNFQSPDEKGSDSKIFVNKNAPFLTDTVSSKIPFDIGFPSSFSPWKQTFDDNANSGWADFEANFGSPTVSQFSNVVTLSDSESKNKMETETSNSNGTKSDPFTVGQLVSNTCSAQRESFFNNDEFGSFESANFEMSDPFKEKEQQFNFFKICDKKAFESVDTNNKKVFESDVGEAFAMPEASLEKAFGTPESSVDKVFGTPNSNDKAFGTPNSSVDVAFGTPDSSLDKAFETPDSSFDKAFETLESNLDKAFGTAESTVDKSFESPDPKAPGTPESTTSGIAESNIDKVFETPESSPEKVFGTPNKAGDVGALPEGESEGKIVINDVGRGETIDSTNTVDRLANEEKSQDPNAGAFEPGKLSSEQTLEALDSTIEEKTVIKTNSELNCDSKPDATDKVPHANEEKASPVKPV